MMTRDEAIKAAGSEAVEAVENKNVDFTNTVTDGTPNMGYTEFSATVELDEDSRLTMYCYIDTDKVKAADDLSDLDWETAIEDTAEFEIVY